MMFEKEAEEYSHNFDWTNDDRIIDYSERGFQKGAEFGYNKAKTEQLEYAKTIIQDLSDNSEWIEDYQKGNEEMKKEAYKSAILTILKLRNCMNCKYRGAKEHSSCKDKGIVLCSHWEMKI